MQNNKPLILITILLLLIVIGLSFNRKADTSSNKRELSNTESYTPEKPAVETSELKPIQPKTDLNKYVTVGETFTLKTGQTALFQEHNVTVRLDSAAKVSGREFPFPNIGITIYVNNQKVESPNYGFISNNVPYMYSYGVTQNNEAQFTFYNTEKDCAQKPDSQSQSNCWERLAQLFLRPDYCEKMNNQTSTQYCKQNIFEKQNNQE